MAAFVRPAPNSDLKKVNGATSPHRSAMGPESAKASSPVGDRVQGNVGRQLEPVRGGEQDQSGLSSAMRAPTASAARCSSRLPFEFCTRLGS